MEIEALKHMIEQGLNQAQVLVQGDGRHFDVVVVTEDFAGKSKVQQQQLVYQVVNEKIASGELHAISLKTYTPQQWQTLSSHSDSH